MSDMPQDATPAEFTRLFRLAEFKEAPEHTINIEATEAECDALAARFSLLSLESLEAQLTVRTDPAGEITVEGCLQAELVQECVVTLDPVSDTVEAAFDQRYTLHPEDLDDDLEFGPDDVEPPEPVEGDAIDLGELVAQFLSLAINPYPRAPGAAARAAQISAKSEDDGPFAALAQLRQGEKK